MAQEVIPTLLKLYAHINIFKDIAEKYGQKQIKLGRVVQKQLSRMTKQQCDIKYLLSCKQNSLIPLFARLKFPIKISFYLHNKIGREIVEDSSFFRVFFNCYWQSLSS